MDVLSTSVPSLLFGVFIPLSTVAVVAIGCGDNRQPANKKRMNAPHGKKSSRKRASVSSSQKRRSRGNKTGSVSSSKFLLRKDKHDSKKNGSKRDLKNTKTSKNISEKAISETSALHESNKPNFISKKNVSIASGRPLSSEKLRNSSSKNGSKLLSVTGTQSSSHKLTKTQEVPRRQQPIDMHLEPNQLSFPATGGLQQINVHNKDAMGHRYAVKAKCSDNLLYRVNPVFVIVEPGKSVSLNVYRNGTPTEDIKMVDKLILAVAEVPMEEKEPQNAFKNRNVKHPMMAIPLLVSSTSAREMAGPISRCLCVKTE